MYGRISLNNDLPWPLHISQEISSCGVVAAEFNNSSCIATLNTNIDELRALVRFLDSILPWSNPSALSLKLLTLSQSRDGTLLVCSFLTMSLHKFFMKSLEYIITAGDALSRVGPHNLFSRSALDEICRINYCPCGLTETLSGVNCLS